MYFCTPVWLADFDWPLFLSNFWNFVKFNNYLDQQILKLYTEKHEITFPWTYKTVDPYKILALKNYDDFTVKNVLVEILMENLLSLMDNTE